MLLLEEAAVAVKANSDTPLKPACLRRWDRTHQIQAALSYDHTLHVAAQEDGQGNVLISVDMDTKHSERSRAQALATLLAPYGTAKFEGGPSVAIRVTFGNEVVAPQPLPKQGDQAFSLAQLALRGNTLFSQVRGRRGTQVRMRWLGRGHHLPTDACRVGHRGLQLVLTF